MGADQNLIKAAAQLGPKPFDYSGIMTAIAAVGKYTNVKRSIANELADYGSANTDPNQMDQNLFNGVYGEQNMEFLTGIKQEWKKSTEIIKNPLILPGSKKYKQAVRNINNYKSLLEKNKADLILWREISGDANVKNLNSSKGMGSEAENRLLDIVIDKDSGEMNSSLIFTPQGVGVKSGDKFYAVNELMDGYQANLVDENVEKTIAGIINKYGYASANAGEPNFQKAEAVKAVNTMIKKAGKNGFAGIRSLAYDYEYNGETFITSQSDSILQVSSQEWIDQALAKDSTLTSEEIQTSKEHTLASAYGYNNQDLLKAGLQNWLVGVVENKFNETTENPKGKSSDKIAMNLVLNKDYSTMRADKQELANAVKAIKSKQSFGIDGSLFAWDKGAQQWVYQDPDAPKIKGKQKLSPVPATPDKEGSEGSAEALLFIFNNDPSISKALGFGDLEKPDLPIIKTED
jgi:hypothetical protein|tara:strand:+ start:788 stop:2170 length:1383 start_codon:yes stop_codon:yes gene_type:complete